MYISPTSISSPKDLALTCRAARKGLGLTQEKLAAQSGVTRLFIVKLEQGESSPDLTRVASVLAILGLDIQIASRRNNAIPPQSVQGPIPKHGVR